MSPEANDPRLTAYALGELDEREAAIFEAELRQSPDGQRALAEIRHTAEMLRQALATEAAPELTAEVRERIIAGGQTVEANGEAIAPVSDEAVPVGVTVDDAHAEPSLRPVSPASPAGRRASWLRRHRIAAAVVALSIVAFGLLWPALKGGGERLSWVDVPPGGADAASRVASDTGKVVLTQDDPSELVVRFNALMDEQRYAEAEVLATRAETLTPDEPVVKQMKLQAKYVRRLAGGGKLTSTDKNGFVEALQSVDTTALGSDSLVQDIAGGAHESQPAVVEARGASDDRMNINTSDSGLFDLAGANPAGTASAQYSEPVLTTESFASSDRRDVKSWHALPARRGVIADQGGGQAAIAEERPSVTLRYADSYGAYSVGGKPATPGQAQVQLHVTPRLITQEETELRLGGQQGQPGGSAGGGETDKHKLENAIRELDEKLVRLRDAELSGEGRNGQKPAFRGGGPQIAHNRDALKEELIKRRKLVGEKLAELEAAEQANTEAYDAIVENPFQDVAQNPLSTFSIDVDTASYANVRRFLNQGVLPPPGAVRIEEMVNYFRYDYAAPKDNEPFAANAAVAVCPWAPARRLVRIGLKGREIAADNRPASNLVFLVDVSGSMRDANKLPLVKDGLRLLVEKLGENDRVAIAVYAGASGLVLPSTLGSHKEKIMYAIDGLEAGGSTNGASGIQLAYDTAVAHFIKGGANRVILATDGDFNVGITDQSQLVDLIEKKAKSGVFLSVLGFGMGNYKDSNLEKLADKGNGNYAYIDSLAEARKVLVEQLSGTLVTIAKDVKIQIEFNPTKVQSYRLIGYENRILAKEDFNDDKKDAGEIGAGHTVTALYELVPGGAAAEAVANVDKLEYQTEARPSDAAERSNDLLTLKLRYKEPDGIESRLLRFPVADKDQQVGAAGDDFEFAAAVGAFGMLLRGSANKGTASYATVLELAQAGLGGDKEGYRREFVELVKKAAAADRGQAAEQ